MPTWEIFTYDNGEILRLVLNGVAAISGNGAFQTLIRISALFGLLFVLYSLALGLRGADLRWFFQFLFVYMVLFVPKVDVVVTDRIDPAQSGVVANVPFALGAFAGWTSLIGDTLTSWMEAINTLPADLKYQQNGAVFASSLVETASQYEITDPDFAENMSAFMRQCVFYDLLQHQYTWKALMEAEDTWAFIEANSVSIARSFPYTSGGVTVIVTCRDGTTQLGNDWATEVDRAAGLYGVRFFPRLNMATAKAKLLNDLPVSYDYLANISKSGGDIIRQNMMTNFFRRAILNAAAGADANAASQDFALAQAERQQMTLFDTVGRMMSRILPMVKNILEVTVYAIFPFVFLIFLLPVGMKLLGTYAKLLIWLQLWAPFYAVLNLFANLWGAAKSSAAAMGVGGVEALSLATHSGLHLVNADMAVVAGYLAAFIPVLSWGLVSLSANFGITALAGAVTGGTQSSASSASQSAATGNIRLADMGAYNAGMFKNDTSPMSNYGKASMTDPATGAVQSYALGGAQAATAMQSNLGANLNTTRASESRMTAGVTKAQQSAARMSQQATTTTNAATSQAIGYSQSIKSGAATGTSDTVGESSGTKRTLDDSIRSAKDAMAKEGYSETQQDQVVGRAIVDGAIGKGGGKSGSPANAKIGGNLSGSKTDTDRYSDDVESKLSAVRANAHNVQTEHGNNFGHNRTASQQTTGDDARSEQLGAALTEAKQAQSAHEAAQSDLVSAEQKAQQSQSEGTRSDAALVTEFGNDLKDAGIPLDRAAALAQYNGQGLQQVLDSWAENKFEKGMGGAAAAFAAYQSLNPGTGAAGSSVKAQVANEIAGAPQEVGTHASNARSQIQGAGAVKQAHAGSKNEVAAQAAAAGLASVGSGAVNLKPVQEEVKQGLHDGQQVVSQGAIDVNKKASQIESDAATRTAKGKDETDWRPGH